ncbi:MAG TPA: alpha/beta hydrolase [Solirubrobacteraceae bacterium]|nr:alpha/beta hydrolase [Solirubrobacteraceae bacterium]
MTVSRPAHTGRHHGLAYGLWLPPSRPRGGVVILHGAASGKESHHDYARAVLAAGFAAVTFDQRGHGESEGPMDGRALEDVVAMASLLRSATGEPELAIALRGSSMGGYFAIVAAAGARARAVVAICPAPPEGLVRGLRAGRFAFSADVEAVSGLLGAHDLFAAVESLTMPLLILHAEGDEQVPVEHSRELIAVARLPESRLIALPGGHHRSVQHDEELQAVSVRFIERALTRTR